MRVLTVFAVVMIFCSLAMGCAVKPEPRLQAYLGPVSEAEKAGTAETPPVPRDGLEAGLLVINDTSAPGSAPSLSQETLAALASRIQEQLQANMPIRLTHMVQPDGMAPHGDAQPFIRLARDRGLNYLVLAIFSSYEVEGFSRLPILGFQQSGTGGGGRVTVPGYVTDSYARVELALLSAESGAPFIRADGRAWATLERTVTPLESNAYPVVRREQLVAPIYPTDADAKAYATGATSAPRGPVIDDQGQECALCGLYALRQGRRAVCTQQSALQAWR